VSIEYAELTLGRSDSIAVAAWIASARQLLRGACLESPRQVGVVDRILIVLVKTKARNFAAAYIH
jgi:hypothetical protein